MKGRHILMLITLSLTFLTGITAELTDRSLAICSPFTVVGPLMYIQDERGRDEVQVTGAVQGTVTDQGRAVIAGAKVTLASRSLTRETTTDESGRYAFLAVPIGLYRLTVRMPGFAVVELDLQVLKGQMSSTDVELRTGPLPTPTSSPSPSATLTPTPTPPPPSPSPSNTPTPAASPTPETSPTPEDPFEAEVKKLVDRAIAFNPPSQMRQGAAEIISARITFQDIPNEVLIEGLPGRGKPQVERIKVSSVMKVALIGDQERFTIQNLNNEEQAVAGKQFAQWEWKVTPLVSGDQELVLRASAIVSAPNRPEKNVDIPVMHRNIKVRVNPFYASRRFLSNNWQWLWTALVVPMALAFWKLKKGKKAQRAGFR